MVELRHRIKTEATINGIDRQSSGRVWETLQVAVGWISGVGDGRSLLVTIKKPALGGHFIDLLSQELMRNNEDSGRHRFLGLDVGSREFSFLNYFPLCLRGEIIC